MNGSMVFELLLETPTAYTGVLASLRLFKADKAQTWYTRFVWEGPALARAFGVDGKLSERSRSFVALRRLSPVIAECVHAVRVYVNGASASYSRNANKKRAQGKS